MNLLSPRTINQLLVAFVLQAPVSAQTTSTSSASISDGDPVELSPFVVQSDRDTGYQATSTMAGTRLNTSIMDLGASISIYTKDLLDDIGATDSGNLLVYATGMEAAGPDGNYSGSTGDINATSVVGNGPRVDPQQSSRTRGLASPNYSRGLFPTNIAFDSYNTERVTVNRGPNAILFGVGSPAGVVDTTLLRPNLTRDRTRIELRYGNNGSMRGTLDTNHVLIDRKLGVRVAALADNEKYNQRPSYQNKRRLYGAVAFAPYKHTALRANFETGHTAANRPISVLPFDSTHMWTSNGRTPYDWSFYDDPARNPDAATQNAGLASQIGFFIGQNTIQNQMALVHNNSTDSVPAYGFRSEVAGTGANLPDAIKAQLFHPTLNRDFASDIIRFYGSLNIFELPAAYWTGDNVLPGQQPGIIPAGLKQQGLTDFSAFDFKNHMIDESSLQNDSFHTFNIAFEQRAWEDRIGIELAYDTQRIDRYGKNSFVSSGGSNHVRIDPNVTLPTGEPNPNVGRPYMLKAQVNYSNDLKQRDSKRATAYLRYNFDDLGDSWAKWLGRHTLTGLYEENAADTISYNHSFALDGAAALSRSPQVNNAGRGARRIVYIGPSLIGNDDPLRLSSVRIPPVTAGPTANVPHYVRAGDATDPGHVEDAPATLVEINTGGSSVREVIRSQAVVLQSHWLRDNLVTLFGWRRDEDYFVRENINFVANPDDLNDPGKVHYRFDDFSFPSTPPFNVAGEVRSYSAVLRWPRELIALPAGTDFSVFYNESSNFTPAGGRINGYGESLPPPQGETTEYGFNVLAFDGKLTLRVNWFETSVRNQSSTPTVVRIAREDAILGQAGIWVQEANVNPHLVESRNADIELLFSALPANYRDLYEYRVTGEPPNVAAQRNQLVGQVDTTDYSAKGMEVEIVYNPTPNWRILANVAKQETVQSNSLPFLKDLIARMTPVWEQLRDRPRSTYPLDWQPGDPLPSSSVTFGTWLDANVYGPYATAIATEGSASAEQRKWRANLVTNYTFSQDILGGKLKGWGIGCGIRWQDKIGIGYPSTRNADNSVNIDVANPYYDPAETNVDAWVTYQRRLWDKVDWKLQLNVRNLIADDTPIAIGVQPWGEVSTVRLAPERRWYLTSTFTF